MRNSGSTSRQRDKAHTMDSRSGSRNFTRTKCPVPLSGIPKKVSRVSGVLDGCLAQQKQGHGGNPDNEDHDSWVISLPMRILRSSRGRELSVWCLRRMSTKRIISTCKGATWQDDFARDGGNCTRKCSTFEIARLKVKHLNWTRPRLYYDTAVYRTTRPRIIHYSLCDSID